MLVAGQRRYGLSTSIRQLPPQKEVRGKVQRAGHDELRLAESAPRFPARIRVLRAHRRGRRYSTLREVCFRGLAPAHIKIKAGVGFKPVLAFENPVTGEKGKKKRRAGKTES